MLNPVALSFIWTTIRKAFVAFGQKELMLRSAALSYYTIFSLPPLLLLILQTTSLFYEPATIRQTIFGQLTEYIGRRSAIELSQTIENIGVFDQEGWSMIIGIGGVLFTATTVFVTIQSTLNKIFTAEEDSDRKAWWALIRGRLIGLALLLSIAFVLIVSLTAQALVAQFIDQLSNSLPQISTALLVFFSLLLPLFMIGFLFMLIFKYLPDSHVDWSTARTGAIITTILFYAGQYAITYYIGYFNPGNMYDAAGSVMVIMVWIFYASAIFYFGAQFTAVYNQSLNRIQPSSDHQKTEKHAVETY